MAALGNKRAAFQQQRAKNFSNSSAGNFGSFSASGTEESRASQLSKFMRGGGSGMMRNANRPSPRSGSRNLPPTPSRSFSSNQNPTTTPDSSSSDRLSRFMNPNGRGGGGGGGANDFNLRRPQRTTSNDLMGMRRNLKQTSQLPPRRAGSTPTKLPPSSRKPPTPSGSFLQRLLPSQQRTASIDSIDSEEEHEYTIQIDIPKGAMGAMGHMSTQSFDLGSLDDGSVDISLDDDSVDVSFDGSSDDDDNHSVGGFSVVSKMSKMSNAFRTFHSTKTAKTAIDDGSIESNPRKADGNFYTLGDHADYLNLCVDPSTGWRYCDSSHLLLSKTNSGRHEKLVKDYVNPIMSQDLSNLYHGVQEDEKLVETDLDPLPVRTLCLRVRPDKKSSPSSIMTAVTEQLTEAKTEPELFILIQTDTRLRLLYTQHAYLLDVQLVLCKTSSLERYLLVRVYHAKNDLVAMSKISSIEDIGVFDDHSNSKSEYHTSSDSDSDYGYDDLKDPDSEKDTHLHLRQSASLVQALSSSDSLDTPAPKRTPTETAAHFQYYYQATTSVRDLYESGSVDNLQDSFPSLSPADWELITLSEPQMVCIWQALEESQNGFWTLSNSDISADIQLDDHFCAQLYTLLNESEGMEELRNTKNETLDSHAALMERQYDIFLKLLENIWAVYGMETPKKLPLASSAAVDASTLRERRELPSTAQDVLKEAVTNVLNQGDAHGEEESKTNTIPKNKDPPGIVVNHIVQASYQALEELADEEFRSYCRLKNKSIMERTISVQQHEKDLVQSIIQCDSTLAQRAAIQFSSLAAMAKDLDGKIDESIAPAAPLLKVEIEKGDVTITKEFILLQQQGLFGGMTRQIFPIHKVTLELTSSTFLTFISNKGDRVAKIKPTTVTCQELFDWLEIFKNLDL